MQQGGFIFLNRNIQDDKENMENLLNYYNNINHPVELLIFPEGTDLCQNAINSSNKFAEKNDLPKYNYCLHPRKTGFQVITSNLLKNNQINYIQDITIGYPQGCIANEKLMIFEGKFPKEVHFHVEKFDIKNIPQDWEGLGEWVEKRFELKEKRLEEFYGKTENQRVFEKYENVEKFEERRLGMYLSLIFWPAVTYLWIKLCSISSSFFYYQIFITIFYAVQPWWFGGFDFLMAVVSKLFGKINQHEKSL